jgi:serine/threonine protein phosphatase 1
MTLKTDAYIAIGDIHGCAKTLSVLLDQLSAEFADKREYVFLGDYVDRGPFSKEVIDILIEFQKSYTCHFIRGNHDQMFLTYYQDTKYYEYLNYGGAHTLESYYASSSDKKVPYSHLRFLVSTKLFYEVNDYVFVHGGLPPTMTIAEALAETEIYSSFLWQREHLETEQNNWEKTVVFGHTPVREPIQRNNMIGIDTGCVYKQFGKLTALILPEIEFIQQKRIDF